MQLTENDILEFMEIWAAEFNEQITPEDAKAHAAELLDLYALLISPSSGETS